MQKYVGQQCTSCRAVFTENDDIVVCPECGSPYHRECYNNEGGCVNTFLHDGKGEWQPKELPKADKEEKICPNCGNKNAPDAQVCAVCGVPTEERNEQPSDKASWQSGSSFDPQSMGMPNLPPFLNIRTIAPETEIDGNTAGEYTSYVGMKFFYFVPKFMRFAKSGSKASFNLSAFFFTHLWFFYRKMPIHGIIIAALTMVSSLTTLLEYGATVLGGYNSLVDDPRFRTLSSLSALLSWGLSIFCGIFGDYMYYKKANRDISAVKSENADSSYRTVELQRRGGTSIPLVMAAVFVFGIVGSIIMSALVM